MRPLELALNEKQIPRFVGNNRKRKQEMENLEGVLILAKQVLSQLSYTPTKGVPFILKHLPRFQNPFLRIFIEWSDPLE